jgi:peptidoglycan/LPS O-acetylase OafA/YrhL
LTAALNKSYRGDIDGLRAIAVFSVMLFHYFPHLITGGFVGVDIFFVISGYLISRIVILDLQKGTFSFVEFYKRRILRIFPALVLMIACNAVFAYFWYLQIEWVNLGKHQAAGALFVSNFLLLSEVSYFDTAADFKPLLHLWSLSIEEQFYIVFPFFAVFLFKKKNKVLTVLALACTLSFIYSIKILSTNPDLAFYSPLARGWELLLGVLISKLQIDYQNNNGFNEFVFRKYFVKHAIMFEHFFGLLGLCLILYSIVWLKDYDRFPGYYALLPTIGTGLILLSQRALISRVVLGNSVLIWFGKISYAMYLWHWILLVNANILLANELSVWQLITLAFLTIIIAWLSTIFFENPIRYSKNKKWSSLILIFCMLGLFILGLNFNNIQTRISSTSTVQDETLDEIEMFQFFRKKYFSCEDELLKNTSLLHKDYIRCFQSKNNRPIDIAIIGDSHAEALFAGLAENLENLNIVYYTRGGLPYLNNYGFSNIYNKVLNDKNIKTVILSAFWANFYGNDEGVHEKELPILLKKLALAGKQVILLEDVPGFKLFPRDCIRLNICSDTVPATHYPLFEYIPIFKRYASLYPNVDFVSVRDYFCSNLECYLSKNGKILFRDRNHLNIDGSLYLGKELVRNNSDLFLK